MIKPTQFWIWLRGASNGRPLLIVAAFLSLTAATALVISLGFPTPAVIRSAAPGAAPERYERLDTFVPLQLDLRIRAVVSDSSVAVTESIGVVGIKRGATAETVRAFPLHLSNSEAPGISVDEVSVSPWLLCNSAYEGTVQQAPAAFLSALLLSIPAVPECEPSVATATLNYRLKGVVNPDPDRGVTKVYLPLFYPPHHEAQAIAASIELPDRGVPPSCELNRDGVVQLIPNCEGQAGNGALQTVRNSDGTLQVRFKGGQIGIDQSLALTVLQPGVVVSSTAPGMVPPSL